MSYNWASEETVKAWMASHKAFEQELITGEKSTLRRKWDCSALRLKHSMLIKLENVKKEAGDCPVCESNNLQFTHSITYGHGDSTHKAQIECNNCGMRSPSVEDWGTPNIKDQIKAWKAFIEMKSRKSEYF